MQSLVRTRKKRKRVRWGRLFNALLLIGIFLVGLFTVFQYIEGTIKELNQPLKNVEAKHSFQGEKNKNDAVNVLLLGSDSRGEKQARTDTIMIAHYDQHTHKVKLISLMRDMYVSIPGHKPQKLNAAYTYGGPELLKETIKENFGLDIHYYAIVDFKGFEKAVDLLVPNGIEVDVPYEMSSGIGMKLEKGKQQLHGKELLGYVRFRHDRLSDFGRVQRQQEVISKLKEKAVSPHIVVKLPELLGLLKTYIDTNIDTYTLLTIGKDILTKKSGDIETIRIPEDGSFQNKRHEEIGEVLEVDFHQNKEALKKFLGGE
ncbi:MULTISPECIES: LCP family protein [unclassified Bacillus (in: firmicutes)]|uniref:LCP family protein n=1 Tax=unclassified Bacillus (in: firmicutes) TaxID=185979 RepID=UPI0027E00EA7|nr:MULTISPECIES: LCP family protein [unclassified Bacillus (in: firmicutes)]